MTRSSRPPIPLLNFRTNGLPDAEAFAHWRELMAPLFNIEKARYASTLPRGNISMFVIGEILASRCTFNAQHLTRDPALIATTPNHLILQYYRSGGFRGTIAGHSVCIVRGQVAVDDLSQETDAYAATSDTIGLTIPRSLVEGIDPELLKLQLDAPRNRLLGGYMATLPKRLKQMNESDSPQVTAEIMEILRRIFAREKLGDQDHAATADEDMLERALAFIEANLAAPSLSPALVADQLGSSKATLYRLFVPMKGVMRYVQERRLMAVRDVLNDPLDRRTLAELAAEHGFTNQALLSRGFRSRFGLSPRDWRQKQTDQDFAMREPSPEPGHKAWHGLGDRAPRS